MDNNRDYAQVLEERDGNGNLLVRYVYGHHLISQTRGGATTYYHYDGLGSTRALTASSEAVTDTYNYDAFGNLLDKTGTTTNNHLFTGEFFDTNIGFYYLRARYMDPNVGRFVMMDTFAGRNRDPYSLHKYLYAHANPVMNIDPSGYETLPTQETKSLTINIFARIQTPLTKNVIGVLARLRTISSIQRTIYISVKIDPVRILLRYLFLRIVLDAGRELLDWLVNEENYKITEFEDDDEYGIYLYKEGGRTGTNFTPRPGKDDKDEHWPAAGLSFVATPKHENIKPGKTFQIINANKLKTLELEPDPEDPEHVLVRPASLSELKAWAATRDNQDKPPYHPWTQEVLDAWVGKGKKPK